MKIYDNPVGVLTNNPPFDMQLFQLNNYMQLSAKSPENHFSDKLNLNTYSRGMGALGLPGDLSSQSRFIRVAFTKMHAISDESEASSVSQFFHILGSVEQSEAAAKLPKENMKSRSTPPAAMPIKGFIITRRMIIIRSVPLICIKKIWKQKN